MLLSRIATLLCLFGLIALLGCGKSPDAQAGLAKTPEQAASQIEQAFSSADTQLKGLAAATSEAMRKNEFENAVVSLRTIHASPEMTADQRLAVYSSAVTLEARLISEMEAGNKQAERAYQLLKALKRD